ncbi:MAG: NAD(P)-dependent oxidoreductase [Rubritalea sp.]|uniref:NAD(P)-dependent oxidoreductase n=1 Tax=Rubritalea sp. TaxID=2109375 RepID=UPI003242C7BA
METIFVSEISYAKASSTFETLNATTSFQFTPVAEDEPTLAAAIRDNNVKAFIADIHPYTGELYTSLPKGGVIARYGVGHDSVNKDLATANGLWVANTPGVLDNAVAEHAVWMIGALARHIHDAHASTVAGQWAPKGGFEIRNRNISILGCGRIGRTLAAKLHHGFGMVVTGYDIMEKPNFAPEDGITHYTTSLDEALKDADYVLTLLPVLESTKHIANAEFFAKMKAGAHFINSARGALVCENDLYDALSNNHLAAAALDVFENEPYTPQAEGKDLRTLPNILVTPHVGSNTEESNAAMASTAAQNIMQILTEGPEACQNIVNR